LGQATGEAWKEVACIYSKTLGWYERLLQEIGEAIGPAAFIDDSGVVHQEVVVEKLPGLVEILVKYKEGAGA
jgi:hypothetical protein